MYCWRKMYFNYVNIIFSVYAISKYITINTVHKEPYYAYAVRSFSSYK